jgi:hypothetical protein
MVFASLPGATDLQSRLQSTVLEISGVQRVASSVITEFLENPDNETFWNNMNTIINSFFTSVLTVTPSVRVLVTLADGTVAYDSSKGSDNTFENYQNKEIGENHNTRVAIMVALLSNNGTGNEIRYSTTTGTRQAGTAIRMGLSTTNPLGVVRISVDAE